MISTGALLSTIFFSFKNCFSCHRSGIQWPDIKNLLSGPNWIGPDFKIPYSAHTKLTLKIKISNLNESHIERKVKLQD